jgi:hypothetical protein
LFAVFVSSRVRLLIDTVPQSQDRLNWKITAHWNPFAAGTKNRSDLARHAPSSRAATWYRLCEAKQRILPRAAAARNRYPPLRMQGKLRYHIFLSMFLHNGFRQYNFMPSYNREELIWFLPHYKNLISVFRVIILYANGVYTCMAIFYIGRV